LDVLPFVFVAASAIFWKLSKKAPKTIMVLLQKKKKEIEHNLKAFSNEINPNPIIFLNRPLTFYYYIKGAITVLTEYFKYYHATCGNAAQLIFTPSSALPELASCV
jgi:hypothetical protein